MKKVILAVIAALTITSAAQAVDCENLTESLSSFMIRDYNNLLTKCKEGSEYSCFVASSNSITTLANGSISDTGGAALRHVSMSITTGSSTISVEAGGLAMSYFSYIRYLVDKNDKKGLARAYLYLLKPRLLNVSDIESNLAEVNANDSFSKECLTDLMTNVAIGRGESQGAMSGYLDIGNNFLGSMFLYRNHSKDKYIGMESPFYKKILFAMLNNDYKTVDKLLASKNLKLLDTAYDSCMRLGNYTGYLGHK